MRVEMEGFLKSKEGSSDKVSEWVWFSKFIYENSRKYIFFLAVLQNIISLQIVSGYHDASRFTLDYIGEPLSWSNIYKNKWTSLVLNFVQFLLCLASLLIGIVLYYPLEKKIAQQKAELVIRHQLNEAKNESDYAENDKAIEALRNYLILKNIDVTGIVLLLLYLIGKQPLGHASREAMGRYS